MVRSTCPGVSNVPFCVAFSCNGATLACGVYSSRVALFDTRSGSKKLEFPGALYFLKLAFSITRDFFSCLSLVCSSFLPLCAFPALCSPPALFRVQLLRSCDKQRFARLCGLSLASAPAPADAPLTHQILITTSAAKAWPSLPSTPISWSTAVVRRCLRGTCA